MDKPTQVVHGSYYPNIDGIRALGRAGCMCIS
jgi:hypothetical protein